MATRTTVRKRKTRMRYPREKKYIQPANPKAKPRLNPHYQTDEEAYQYQIIRTVQSAPYNGTREAKRLWKDLKWAIIRFMKETHRPHLTNALYVLLEAGITAYRQQHPELYPIASLQEESDSLLA